MHPRNKANLVLIVLRVSLSKHADMSPKDEQEPMHLTSFPRT